jgi:protein-arginine kinase activator protein McsA
MTIKYDSDNNCEVHTCSICGYIYNYYYDYNKQTDNTEEPFIKLETPLLHTVSRGWEPDRIEKISQYACPKCGVLQVDTRSL